MQYEWAQPGRLVVCVDDSDRAEWLKANWPDITWKIDTRVVRGTVYAVERTTVHPVTHEICLKLEGVSERSPRDYGYDIARFRPVNTQIIDNLLKVEENA